MKILYISQYFPPEMGRPRRSCLRTRRPLVGGRATKFPFSPDSRIIPPVSYPTSGALAFRGLTYREQVDGVTVFRTWLWPLPNRKAHERMRNYASFCVSAALRGLTLPRPDVVIASSPQLLVGLSGWWISFTRQVPLVFEVRDLWPESLVAVGAGRENSLLHIPRCPRSPGSYTNAQR